MRNVEAGRAQPLIADQTLQTKAPMRGALLAFPDTATVTFYNYNCYYFVTCSLKMIQTDEF